MSEVPGAFWNFCLPGEAIDSTKYNEMHEQKVIAHNLKAAKEQIIDDLNGVIPPSPAQDNESTPCPFG